MRVRFVLERNGVRLGDKRAWVVIDGKKSVSDAMMYLNKRHSLLASWDVDQVKIACCVDDSTCEDLSAIKCEISPQDVLCEVIQDDICIVVVPNVVQDPQSIVNHQDNNISDISSHGDSVVARGAEAVVPQRSSTGATQMAASGRKQDGVSRLTLDSDSEEDIASKRMAPARGESSNKRQKVAHAAPEVASVTRAPTSCNSAERSFCVGSNHYIYHDDTGMAWSCTVYKVLRDQLFDICINVPPDAPGNVCSGLITVARDQLLEKTRARRQVFDKVWADVIFHPFETDSDTESDVESAETFETRPRATVRRTSALQTNVRHMPEQRESSKAGWIHYEPHNERTVYYAHENETPRQIAKKLGVEPKRLVSDNKNMYKEPMTLSSKLGKCAELALPLKCKWSPVADDFLVARPVGNGVAGYRRA